MDNPQSQIFRFRKWLEIRQKFFLAHGKGEQRLRTKCTVVRSYSLQFFAAGDTVRVSRRKLSADSFANGK
ncbi:hypothetical protein AX777_18460 [Sphingobium yanoikuyae]|uniref:Uncharacterized protein n=1 Tax=Sphingobium yanoikuyae TaxID=13690 RepID=A0A177JR55_SPHYA|nr:hypothetical protein AX777_18460 [Sphingobium yanoikuyae]